MKLISAVSFLLLLGDARVASGSPSIRGGVIETDQERKLQGNRYNGKGQPWQGKGNGNGNGNSNASGKNKGAAVRAFDVSDVAGPDVASILSGEQIISPSYNGSEASLIFEMIAELAQAGTSHGEMEGAMNARGYDTETIQAVLSNDDNEKEKVMNLMRGLIQKKLIEDLSAKDEDIIKGNSKNFDAFGNKVKGPDRLKPSPPGHSVAPKPSSTGKPHDLGQFGGHSDGPGSELIKPTPNDHGRHLVAVPEGCDVPYPEYVGDGYCDMSGGYNTEACNWDGGDCCDFTCAPGQEYVCGVAGYDCKSCQVSNPEWVGDGYCDSTGGYNTAGCGNDGGDCCSQTCADGDYTCGEAGYDCNCESTAIVQADVPNPGSIGPGFKIRNDTPWPVEISLWQVGPLYWELVQPGQYFYRETGAVWFTAKATIRMDNEPSIDAWDAIWPIGTIVLSVALAFVTAGSSSALSASIAAGGSAGSVSATTVAAVSSWLVGMGMNASGALYLTTASLFAAKTALLSSGVTTAIQEAVLEDISFEDNWLSASDAGTYAGYAWPFMQETQAISVHGGPVLEPAHLGNQCVNLYREELSGDLQLSCLSGSCWLG